MAVGQALHPQLHAVFAAHTVFKHVELQGAHHAHYNVLIAAAGELEDLDGALLGDLLHTLDELLALHGVLGRYGAEQLRLKGRDTGIAELLPRHGDGVPDGEDTRVEHADDISGIGLVYDLPLGGHHGLGLGQPHLLVRLHMIILCIPLKFPGADAHKGQSIPMGLVHVGLNLEHKGGKIRGESVHHAFVTLPG